MKEGGDMNPLNLNDVKTYVENHIGSFHERRLLSLRNLKLDKVLKRKNPYLFRAKNILLASDLVEQLLKAHLSSQEEGIFGEFLEGLAIFVCERVYDGRKSDAEGIDLEFNRDGIRYIVSIKSGPNWGNSGQISNMVADFKAAGKRLRTSNSGLNVRAVNGCCYGVDKSPDKGEYLKLCGQEFWKFISGDDRLFVEIIEPLGYRSKERNEDFQLAYSQIVNRFAIEFSSRFCDDGLINWEKMVIFNSGNSKQVVK